MIILIVIKRFRVIIIVTMRVFIGILGSISSVVLAWIILKSLFLSNVRLLHCNTLAGPGHTCLHSGAPPASNTSTLLCWHPGTGVSAKKIVQVVRQLLVIHRTCRVTPSIVPNPFERMWQKMFLDIFRKRNLVTVKRNGKVVLPWSIKYFSPMLRG